MDNIIISIIAGIVLIVTGVINTKGNLALIHKYHIKRVKPEHYLPFGRLVGLGSIIIGATLFILGVFSLIALLSTAPVFETVGLVIFVSGLVVGFVFICYAMIKYNKGFW